MERVVVHVARVAGMIDPRAVRAWAGSSRAARSPADARGGALVGGCLGLRRAGGLPACRVAAAGESFDVEGGAAEQQLDVEQAGAATSRAAHAALGFELGDASLGVTHPPDLRPHTGGGLATLAGGQRLAFGVGP